MFQFTVADVEFEREKIIFIAHKFFFNFLVQISLQLFYPSSKGLNLILACPT